MDDLKSSEEYLLNLQKMIQKRSDLYQLYLSKKKLMENMSLELTKIHAEIANFYAEVQDLDKRISISTI